MERKREGRREGGREGEGEREKERAHMSAHTRARAKKYFFVTFVTGFCYLRNQKAWILVATKK